MTFYRLTNRTFSRRWRRNKDYTEKQLNLLAKHSRSILEKFRGGLRVKKGDKCVATFEEVEHNVDIPEDRQPSLYASLRNPARGRVVLHTVRSAVSVAKSV
jgi:hypothetical protein